MRPVLPTEPTPLDETLDLMGDAFVNTVPAYPDRRPHTYPLKSRSVAELYALLAASRTDTPNPDARATRGGLTTISGVDFSAPVYQALSGLTDAGLLTPVDTSPSVSYRIADPVAVDARLGGFNAYLTALSQIIGEAQADLDTDTPP